MLRKLRPHLSYANVAATLALVIAVGGGSAWAAQKIRTRNLGYHAVTASKLNYNAVTGSKVRNSSLSGKDLRDGTVGTLDVRNGSLRTEDFGAGQLPKGDKGDKGDPATELHGTVSAAGVVVNGTGVTAVSPGTGGAYTVTFAQDVSKCPVVATVGDTDGGTVSAVHAATAQQITFRTRNLDGVDTEQPFHFAVFC